MVIVECGSGSVRRLAVAQLAWDPWARPGQVAFTCEAPVESLDWLLAAVAHVQLPLGRRLDPFIVSDLDQRIQMCAIAGGFGDATSPASVRRSDDWRAAVKASASEVPEEALAMLAWANCWRAEDVRYVADLLDRWTEVRPGGDHPTIRAGLDALLADEQAELRITAAHQAREATLAAFRAQVRSALEWLWDSGRRGTRRSDRVTVKAIIKQSGYSRSHFYRLQELSGLTTAVLLAWRPGTALPGQTDSVG